MDYLGTGAIFGIGCIGALAPEIVRAYQTNKHDLDTNRVHLMVTASFIILGGFAALILAAQTYYNAFYDGAAAPVLISALAGKMPSVPPNSGGASNPPTPSPPSSQPQGVTQPTAVSVLTTNLSTRQYLGALFGASYAWDKSDTT